MNSINHQKKRPKNLNLLSVKFPMSAIMSVGHRAAGVLLFLSLPYFIYIFQLSLTNEAGFLQAQAELQGPIVKLFSLIVIWS
ncbi:MAG: succinate dehydrogenase, cytochrome b556 subunit, partial [Gammaproteobacteria bacterium]|nr:succinate dehydrogenase, cytochrome b556 subunit [Gammaproteobacteria bacterium]